MVIEYLEFIDANSGQRTNFYFSELRISCNRVQSAIDRLLLILVKFFIETLKFRGCESAQLRPAELFGLPILASCHDLFYCMEGEVRVFLCCQSDLEVKLNLAWNGAMLSLCDLASFNDEFVLEFHIGGHRTSIDQKGTFRNFTVSWWIWGDRSQRLDSCLHASDLETRNWRDISAPMYELPCREYKPLRSALH